ncbi:MAG: PorT family protein, partial [Muribaculaceae bacterium]|nr:PorT family protein [Muribaculaceae bacterium]
MKTFRRIALALALVLAVAGTASAQFRFGVRAGIQTNSLHFEKSTFDEDNRVGFTGGVMAEFTVPVVGVGADVSLMYTHRNQGLAVIDADGAVEDGDRGLNYIEIPLNLKWKIGIPVIQK